MKVIGLSGDRESRRVLVSLEGMLVNWQNQNGDFWITLDLRSQRCATQSCEGWGRNAQKRD